MAVVKTKKDLCQACYSCVRDCPAKAVKVESGQARVVEERCISCGNCVRVCSQDAKDIESQAMDVRNMLDSGDEVIALLAPSFPASFYFIDREELLNQMRALGFKHIDEVAGGVELTLPSYRSLIREGKMETIISSHCPAIVGLVERQFPELIPMLAPVDSALLALGKYMRKNNPGARLVFIGPCIAKKEEVRVYGQGIIDAVLTFGELKEMLGFTKIDSDDAVPGENPQHIKANSPLFPVPGGFIKNIDPQRKLFKFEDVALVEGKDECLQFLESLAAGKIKPRLVDILFCKGCIDGPGIDSPLDIFARQHLIYDYARKRDRKELKVLKGMDLSRHFVNRYQPLPVPSENEIQAILRHTYKTKPEHELNCGSCGYNSCREKAVAVYQGIAEIDMCLPYLLAQSRGELDYYRNRLDGSDNTEGTDLGLIGSSDSMKELKNLIMKVSQNDATVLILGESGVGKEVIAKAIHRLSIRRKGPFIGINCAALPELLLESELFGYEDGAFTGARKGGKVGRLELAKGGTILLDEIGDLPLTMQAKLLRVLQEKEFTRLGGCQNIPLDARILAATNKDLKTMVTQGKFRADLFYRLNVLSVHVPSLRERKEDISALIGHFLHRIATEKEIPAKIVTDEALRLLLSYEWPGNIRELENTVERLVYICEGNVIRVTDLPAQIRQLGGSGAAEIIPGPLKEAVSRLEREMIIKALEATGNNRMKAASILGVPRATFYQKLKEYNIP